MWTARGKRGQQSEAGQHLYKTARWKRLRARQLKRHPYCQCPHCKENPTCIAEVVDHINKHSGDKRKFFDTSNLRSLMKECHDRFKQSEERGGHGFMRGCDEDGQPLNREHSWWA